MWPYHEALLATPVPRYTSYPTAADFSDAPGAVEMAAELARIEAETPLSLYLHIPFCEQICWYCGCNTGRTNKAARLSSYMEALDAEIDLLGALLDGRGRIERIAFGGGSPNAIAPDIFLGLVERLKSRLNLRDPVMSVEVDPRSFTPEWAEALGEAGVSRVSLGVQTLSEPIQRAIGRVQPLAMIETVVGQLRGAGVSSINFDLMYGLPEQGLAELDETLSLALAMRPERIALFGYAHVPHIIPRQKQIVATNLPDARLRFDQAALGHERIVAQGYAAIGFDHFAVPEDAIAVAARAGKLRRNFQGFTEDQADILLGLGASSISQFPGAILQTEKNAGRYRMNILAGRLPQAHGILRSAADQQRGHIIERLLCVGEADFSGLPDREALAAKMESFVRHDLVTLDGHVLVLKEAARPYSRVIAACFDAYREIAPRKFSSAI
jgi:oxygen-independent coproporphyrinogen-3 oxidase